MCWNGDSSSSSSLRRVMSRAAGMCYYFIITLIFFRSPLWVKTVMAVVVAAATAPAPAEGTAGAAGGTWEWERVDESVTNPAATTHTPAATSPTRSPYKGPKHPFTLSFGPGILTVFIFDCLVQLIHTYFLWKKKKKIILCLFSPLCLMIA